MKKISHLALIAILSVTLTTSCTQEASKSTTAEPVKLKDGTYSASITETSKDSIPEIEIIIKEGKITAVKYDEIIAMKKSEDIEYKKSFKAQKNIDLLTVYTTVQNNLIKTQDPEKLDTIAGATATSKNIKALAIEALKNAKNDAKFIDGNYVAKGALDERNWTPSLTLTIKDNKIVTVKYDEISSRIFRYKSHDAAYIARFKALKKLDLTAVYDILQKSLVEKQDPAKVDAVAGATSSTTSFIEVAKKALEKAKIDQ